MFPLQRGLPVVAHGNGQSQLVQTPVPSPEAPPCPVQTLPPQSEARPAPFEPTEQHWKEYHEYCTEQDKRDSELEAAYREFEYQDRLDSWL